MFYNMTFLTHLFGWTLQNSKPLIGTVTTNLVCIRYASKKSSSVTTKTDNRKPKHRGVKKQDGTYVQQSTILATQLRPRFHPGLYVGIGKNGTLYALESGKVMITCEKINPNDIHWWAKLNYGGRKNSVIYKKYFNVIPKPQHNRFVVIDTV